MFDSDEYSDYSEEETALNLLRGLNDLRKEGTFCDVTLRVRERTIQVHKNVISVSSPYFRAMLSGNFAESKKDEIPMEDLDGKYVELLIEYMYTGRLNIHAANVKDILHTAMFLQMTRVEGLCFDFIEEVLNVENIMEYLLFGRKELCECLVEMALRTAVACFGDIFSRRQYLELEFDELKRLAQMLLEKGLPEDIIFSFVMRWIDYSPETRTSFMEELLELMDPSLISPSVLHFVHSNPVHIAWANAARLPNEPADHILLSSLSNDILRTKILPEAQCRQIESIPEHFSFGTYVCNGYYIFHQGGWKGGKAVTESFVYHPTKRVWNSFVPLQQARAVHNSCVFNGKIFSVAGMDDERALASVEFTDLYTGQRGFINPLPRAKSYVGLGLYGNSIFVIGGEDRENEYKCNHRFDVREGVWHELAPSPFTPSGRSCGVVGESIYTTYSDALQRYDIRANNWEIILTEDRRYPVEVFALDNTLFGRFSYRIDRFIPERREWEIQRTWRNTIFVLHVYTNLLFPNVNEEDIKDPIFEL